MVSGLIAFLVLGAVAGYLARLLMPGPDPMGCLATTALGTVGSLVGGTLGSLLFDGQLELDATGLIGSVIGAMIVLFLLRRGRARRYHP
ncbi:MAG TPA: GlsB/YeaQ/YmgE family stress response membrane protein [Nitriliruptorales bacterium]|nr:GlsB/YeaQ/YmgE family stress response membrane protein [Nitriliruptorales bacterium]